MADRTLDVRDSRDDDVAGVADIYAHWVSHSLGSFELEPPSEQEIARRRAALLAGGFPYLVAEDAGDILGYAYAGPYRPRPAYRFSCENSVYVAPAAARRGVGRALLSALIARCEADGYRLMIAVIGDSANESSIGLHAALGFTHAGLLPAIGWKRGCWVDTVLMTRSLGVGCSSAPDR
ncbi:MAG TPA: GNAT family N-acetyltransferase [Rhizomicrobium sp.]